MLPVLPDLFERGARGGRSPEATHQVAGVLGIPPYAEPEDDFTFLPSGTFTFTPSAFSIPQPKLSIVSSGGVNTISFSSVSGINYTLLSSTDLTAPLSTWSVVGSSVVSGNGSTQSITDSPANATYYILVAY